MRIRKSANRRKRGRKKEKATKGEMKRDRQIEKQAVIWKKSNNKKTSWFLKRKEAR